MKQLLMALSAYPWPRSALLRILFDRLRQKVGQIVSLQDRQAHWRLTLGGRYPVGIKQTQTDVGAQGESDYLTEGALW